MVHMHDLLHRARSNSMVRAAEDFAGELVSHSADTLERLSGQRNSNNDDQGVSTVLSVVYVTMSATFSGSTAGFVTETGKAANTVGAKSTTGSASAKETSHSATNSQSTAAPTVAVGSPIQATREPTATSTSSTAAQSSIAQPASQSGMGSGAKIGIAVGVLLLVVALAGAAISLIRRRKPKQEPIESHNLDNEKNVPNFTNVAKDRTSRAPRLTLRPVTQFLPSLNEPKVSELTSATGGLNPLPMPSSRHQSQGAWDLRPVSNQSADVANPFGHTAERLDPAAAEKAAENAPIPVSVPSSPSPAAAPRSSSDPFSDKGIGARVISPEGSRPGTALSYVTTAEVITTAAPAASDNAAAAPRNPPSPNSQQNTVHRVQLDFKPSMEDELELRAGQLIKILHEYDDGWALCMYMDRSKQGVAPRTCLSKLALKPRPTGPPPGMAPLRPQSPASRTFSGPPAIGLQDSLFPAPLSPSTSNMTVSSELLQGPHSPPGGRQRSQSQSQSEAVKSNGSSQLPQSAAVAASSPSKDHRRSASMSQLAPESPERAALPSRKPVPGQAI